MTLASGFLHMEHCYQLAPLLPVQKTPLLMGTVSSWFLLCPHRSVPGNSIPKSLSSPEYKCAQDLHVLWMSSLGDERAAACAVAECASEDPGEPFTVWFTRNSSR